MYVLSIFANSRLFLLLFLLVLMRLDSYLNSVNVLLLVANTCRVDLCME